MEMICLGRRIGAEEAKARNLVTEVFPHEKFRQMVDQRLNEISTMSAPSFNLSKSLSRKWDKQTLLKINEEEVHELSKRFMSPESFEAMFKFMNKGSKM